MSTERLLTTVLGLYQDVHDAAQTERILGSTTTLLASLHNPLNLSLLTSQFLTAPAIWHRPLPGNPSDGLATCFRVISIFNTAALHVRKSEIESAARKGPPPAPGTAGGGLGSEAWTRAVVKGADDRSARWQHLLVLTGVLLGLEGNDRRSLSWSMRHTLENGLVTAANLALEAHTREGPLSGAAIVLALNYAFPLLSDGAKRDLDCDALLPLAIEAMAGPEGFQGGLILSAINAESGFPDGRLRWPSTAYSFQQLRQLESRPLVASVGPLSKLIAYAVEHARQATTVLEAQDVLFVFTEALERRWWTSIHLSGFDISIETAFLSPETARDTWPALWQHLKKIMYATVVALQAMVARSLLDAGLWADAVAPTFATRTLHILRNLYFISSRQGAGSFQLYTFTYLASIDALTRYAGPSTAFLAELLPPSGIPGRHLLPSDPSRLTADLFYLNVAEHFSMTLAPDACEALIVRPAMEYLTAANRYTASAPVSPLVMELFEAAHSAVLSVLSVPENAPITAALAPVYAEILFSSFPSRISPRQFRLAFKTLMQVLSPPFPVWATHPALAETLLEMVRMRAATAGTTPLPPSREELEQQQAEAGKEGGGGGGGGPVSEQSALVLTMVDALPFLALDIVEEWMTAAAEALWDVADAGLREVVKRRFWDVLVSGEMDVERAALGVAWWGTKGGGELVLHGRRRGRPVAAAAAEPHGNGNGHGTFMMSGAILDERGASKL